MEIRSLILIILVLHLAACVILTVLLKLKMLMVPAAFLPILYFVPVWGEISVLACHMLKASGRDGSLTAMLERNGADEEVYRSLIPEPETSSTVIPLEEALLLNDSGIKRSMILDILSKQPEEYINLLKEARENDDVEVVHYATTAMSELSKEYDLKLQKLEAAYASNQKNEDLLKEYAAFLKEYIEKDMAQGQFLVMQRNQYSLLLQNMIDRYDSFDAYKEKTENELALGNYEESARLLELMEIKWQDSEEYWLLKIRHFAQQMEGNKVKEILEDIQNRELYLTADGKSIVEFWRKGGAGL